MKLHSRRDLNETMRHRLARVFACCGALSGRGVRVQKVVIGVSHTRPKLIVDPVTVGGKLHGATVERGTDGWVRCRVRMTGCVVEWRTREVAA